MDSASPKRQSSIYSLLNKISDQIVKIETKIETNEEKFNQNL